MIQYRPFLNTDPPLIVELWKRQPPLRGQVAAITSDMLEQHVFSKPYFDRNGFLLAIDSSAPQPRALGFVHAGFSARRTLTDINPQIGVISQLKLDAGEHQQAVGSKLLRLANEYLSNSGATQVEVGSQFPFAPFYLGLYGGSRLPGVLANDTATVAALTEAGFQTEDKICILERSLTGFRTIVNRDQMRLRRQYVIRADGDPMERSWWESCTLGGFDRDRFTVTDKTSPNECGTVSYWDMEPLAQQTGASTRGLYDLAVLPELRRTGLATFLVGESLRHLMQQGASLVEAQTRQSDEASRGVFDKLGFQQVDEGLLMNKTLA